jgi:ElaB/YqjD/DUF883 family membrane-anchored ribosome-binding protein
MGLMDDTTDNMSDMGDAARQRYEELRDRQQDSDLNETERNEYNTLRDRYEDRGNE